MSGHANATPVIAIPGADRRLYNQDLAPVAPAGRDFRRYSGKRKPPCVILPDNWRFMSPPFRH